MIPWVATVVVCLLSLPAAKLAVAGFQPGVNPVNKPLRQQQEQQHNRCNHHFPRVQKRVVSSYLEASTNDDGDESKAAAPPPTTSSHPWRVVMDIGREPLANMPFNWARQGVRMPLVVPTDFGCDTRSSKRFVAPRSETVGFTGSEGARESPIVGNSWSISEDNGIFEASYTIVNELRKRDVSIEAGTELHLSTRCFTQTELDRLNEEYYQAREAMWSTGGDLNDASNRQQSAKKWNPQTERWEKRYPDENPLDFVKNTVLYWMQNAKQEKAKSQRPEPETLSDRGGRLPGVGSGNGNGGDDADGEYVYLVQQGAVRYGGVNGPVCGLWTAQPITNVPAWDRGR